MRSPALIPPPRRHRHRYFGVLTPNARLRAAVTSLASQGSRSIAGWRATRTLLLVRIYEIFPLRCSKCDGEMRILASIEEAMAVRETLAHLGEPTCAPRMASARAPPL